MIHLRMSVPSSPAEIMPETTSPESSGGNSADDNQTEGSQPSAPLPPVGHYGIASNPFHTLFQRLGAALAPFFTPDKGSALRRRVYEKIISSPESDLRNTISRLENRISQLEHTIDVSPTGRFRR